MDLIDPYLKALREKDYRVDGLTVNLLGLSTFARYYNKSDEGFIVEIDKDQYEGALSSSNAYFEALYGSFGNEAEHVKAERINNDLETSNTLSGQKIIHGGPLIILKDKSPTLKEAIKVRMHQAVSFLDDTHFGLGLGGKDLKPIPYEAVGGVLESIWIDSWKINLFKKGRHSESKPPWIITLLLLLVLGILIGIYWTTPIEIETKRLQHLDKQIALKRNEVKKVETLKKEIESVSTEINLINNFKQVKPLSINILRELTALLPKNAWLTRIRIFETQINIEGYAPSATSLIPRLEGSPLFKKIEYAAPTFKDTRQNMDRFQIKMELKNP
jgi:Tfp pilus assembly protein PilN